MEEQPEEHEQLEEEEVPLPDYAQIEGQTIKLSGLDYSLIKEEAAKDRKNQLMSRLKHKLNEYNIRLPLAPSSQQTRTHTNDQLTKNIVLANSLKPSLDPATFYLFPSQPHFAPHLPQLITRRFGKMHVAPLYIHHPPEDVEMLRQLITRDEQQKQTNRLRLANSDKVVAAMHSEDDSDDIFGQSEGEEQQQIGPTIQVGNKLNFGINDIQVFGPKRYRVEEQAEKQLPKQVDKYEFLRKKVKPNEQGEDYGQCYPITGPSLDEMRELRKEGIELFGDAKEFVEKKQKYDVNKDYQKIKRIIDEKSKAKP